MTIARYYDESKNPPERMELDAEGKPTVPVSAYLGGVPLRDLTEAEWDALPDHLQASVDASPFYRKTKPPSAAAKPSPKPATKPADMPDAPADAVPDPDPR